MKLSTFLTYPGDKQGQKSLFNYVLVQLFKATCNGADISAVRNNAVLAFSFVILNN